MFFFSNSNLVDLRAKFAKISYLKDQIKIPRVFPLLECPEHCQVIAVPVTREFLVNPAQTSTILRHFKWLLETRARSYCTQCIAKTEKRKQANDFKFNNNSYPLY